jgi:uncharacterized protein
MATIPTGRFVWFEYVSKDASKVQPFFGELFHWKTKQEKMPSGPYTMITLGDRRLGGFDSPTPGVPEAAHWLPYLQVANAREVASKVKSLGGKIVKEPVQLGEMATMSVVLDPFGAPFALWQPNNPQGTGDYTSADGAFIWNELYTPDPDKAVSFYKSIGGFEHEQMKGERTGPARYDILNSDGKGRAGIMKMEGVPPQWMPYVMVANPDQTVEQAKRLGGTAKHPPETLEGVGRLAVIADPLGGIIGLLKPNPR